MFCIPMESVRLIIQFDAAVFADGVRLR